MPEKLGSVGVSYYPSSVFNGLMLHVSSKKTINFGASPVERVRKETLVATLMASRGYIANQIE